MRYSIIYSDPPWQYNNRREIRKDGGKARIGFGASSFYPTMQAHDIANLHVCHIAADNAALFMWATWTHLEEALRIMGAWGFDYKGLGFIWVKRCLRDEKPFFGVGYYTKSNTEPCLLGIKGRMKPVSNSVSEVIIEPHPRNEDGMIIHSRKPAIVRDKIVELFGDLPRVEMFSRESAPGWDTWGNECEQHVCIPQQLSLFGRSRKNDLSSVSILQRED